MLSLQNGDLELRSVLAETRSRFGSTEFSIVSASELAFDHAAIIAGALAQIKSSADNFEVLFDFLPEKCTMANVQKIQSIITDINELSANFRRKITSYVEETNEYVDGKGHRPSKLFRRKQNTRE